MQYFCVTLFEQWHPFCTKLMTFSFKFKDELMIHILIRWGGFAKPMLEPSLLACILSLASDSCA